jgi:hypothetical protein
MSERKRRAERAGAGRVVNLHLGSNPRKKEEG